MFSALTAAARKSESDGTFARPSFI